MDSKICNILRNYRISDLEIQDMLSQAPMLDIISYEEFVVSCKMLVQYGYPKSDLDFLFLSNPNIFVLSKDDLERELIALREKYKDIELVLKNNPTII